MLLLVLTAVVVVVVVVVDVVFCGWWGGAAIKKWPGFICLETKEQPRRNAGDIISQCEDPALPLR